jgi:hypothetical protein
MATPAVRFQLENDDGEARIDARAFAAALQASTDLLTELGQEISGGKFRWYIVGLGIGSGIAETAGEWIFNEGDPLIDDPAHRAQIEKDVVSSYVDGLSTLDRGADWPAHFTEGAIEAAGRFAGVLGDHVIAIRASVPALNKAIVVTERVVANVKELEARSFTDVGSIEGRVVGISLARSPFFFSVREPLHGWLITCRFSSDQIDIVRELLMRRVAVRGKVLYADDGRPVRLSAIREIRKLDTDKSFNLAEFIGIAPEFTEELSSEDFINREWNGERE